MNFYTNLFKSSIALNTMRFSYSLIMVFILFTLTYSAVVLVNSNEPRDILVGTFHGIVNGDRVIFYSKTMGVEEVESQLNGQVSIVMYTSNKVPAMPALASLLEADGYSVDEIKFDDYWELNRDLLESDNSVCKGYVITNPKYGQNLIPLVPFVRAKNYCVVYFDGDHSVPESVVNSEKPVFLYGTLEADLGVDGDSIIGDNRYLNSYKLADLLLDSETPEVLFADGNFVEASLVDARLPIVLVSAVLPKDLENYAIKWVNEGRLKVGTLIGSTYAPTLKQLKDVVKSKTGEELHVFVKVAKGVAGQMYNLDVVPFQSLKTNVQIASMSYNSNSQKLEVVYENTGDIPVYVLGRYDVFVDGSQVASVGDESPVKVARGQKFGVSFDLPVLKDKFGDITVNVSVMYGEAENLLEDGFYKSFEVGRNEFEDTSELKILSADYFADENLLKVKISNPSPVKVFFKISFDYECDDGKYQYSDDRVYDIAAENNRVLPFPEFADCEVSNIKYSVMYGAREGFLTSKLDGDVNFATNKQGFDITLLLVIALIVAGAAVFYLKFVNGKGGRSRRFGRW